MSGPWSVFPCNMDGRSAWIACDESLASTIDTLPHPYCARFRVTLQSPDAEGLPGEAEDRALGAVAEVLVEALGEGRGVLAGGFTVGGHRVFVCYTSLDEAACFDIGRRVQERTGYAAGLAHHADPQRELYWQQLHPTDEDRQVMSDVSLERQLHERGDSCTKPRPVEHWAYFPAEANRDAFIAAVGMRFDAVERAAGAATAPHPFGVRLRHVTAPSVASMHPVTLLLVQEARRHGGKYDGWETGVVPG